MNIALKIMGPLLDEMRKDLNRRHPFAHERVGFLTAGAAEKPGGLILIVRNYRPVDDQDYEHDPRVGARIGSNAMRKAVQSIYRPAGVLLHVHTHGGSGRPEFSGIDLKSAYEFVPGFFETTSKMPHGLLVLSNDSARGLLWLTTGRAPVDISSFVRVGSPTHRSWRN